MMDPSDRIPGAGEDLFEHDPAPVGESAPVREMPRGVLVFPFVVAAGLTLLVLMGMGQPMRGRSIIVVLLIGSIAAVSSVAWFLTHPPRSDATPQSAPRDEPQADPSGTEPDSDPLANIQAVESQGRRHRKPCPNCGTEVGSRASQCPNCAHRLSVQCKGCRTNVRLEWGACPECGRSLP